MLWKEEYATGIPEIDKQNMTLIRPLEEILLQLSKKNYYEAKSGCQNYLHFMQAYAPGYFQNEESLMGEKGYPYIDLHHKQHQDFLSTLTRYEMELKKYGEDASLLTEFVSTILTWFIYHIQKLDKLYYTSETPVTTLASHELIYSIDQSVKEIYQTFFFEAAEKEGETIFFAKLSGSISASVLLRGGNECFRLIFSYPSEMLYRQVLYVTNIDSLDMTPELVMSSLKRTVSSITTKLCTLLTTNATNWSVSSPQLRKTDSNYDPQKLHIAKTLHYKTGLGTFEILIYPEVN